MRKITVAALTTLTLGIAQADYTIKIPLEADKGGSLPNGSVTLNNPTPIPPLENWQPYEPEYSAWVNQGEPYDCTNWSPEPSTVPIGQSFTQTATDCQQDQTRARQDLEQETTTLEIRSKGTTVTESQTATSSSTRSTTGTMQHPPCISNINGVIFSAGQNYKSNPANGDYAYISSGLKIFKSLTWGLNIGTNLNTLTESGYTYRFGEKIADHSFADNGIDIEGTYEICREPI